MSRNPIASLFGELGMSLKTPLTAGHKVSLSVCALVDPSDHITLAEYWIGLQMASYLRCHHSRS